MSYHDFLQKMEGNIREHGRTVIGVLGERPFHYTIGNSLKSDNVLRRMPELLLIGPWAGAVAILNELSIKMIERDSIFSDRELILLAGGTFPVMAIEAIDGVKTKYTSVASQYHAPNDYPVVQVVFCDPAGRYPWQPGCAEPYCVPVYPRNPIQ